MSENEAPTFNDITREQWQLYLQIQRSGQTNMNDAAAVELLSDFELDRATQKTIRLFYDELAGKYGK